MDAEGLPFAAMGLAAPVVDHPLPVMGDVVPVQIPVVHVGPVLPPVAPVVDHPLPVMGDVVPVQIPVVHAGPILLPDAPIVDHPLPVMGDVVPVQIPVVHAGPVLLPDSPVVHPGPVLLPVALDVVPDPNANQPALALPPLLDGPDLPVLPHHGSFPGMAIFGELKAPVGDMDATVDRTKVGSGRALDTAGFRPRGYSHAKAGAKSSAQPGVKASANAFTEKKVKADGETSGKTGFVIPGLWTPEVAKQKELDDALNQSLVHLKVKLPTIVELSSYQTCYMLHGKLNLKDLAERICYKVNLEMGCPMKFSIGSVDLSEETTISAILKKYEAPDGFLYLSCDIAQDPLKHGWITVARKNKNVAKNARDLTIQQASQKLTTKTGSVTAELVTESVCYSKFPSCKPKGSRKMSQFFKKKQMQLAMEQKSPFVQTKEGPAVRSFGTYGPSGNLQFYY